jgi:capsular exopolysaccharide synthesis family protein
MTNKPTPQEQPLSAAMAAGVAKPASATKGSASRKRNSAPDNAENLSNSDSSVNLAHKIDYTHTRRVELNRKVLMDNRVVAAFEADPRAGAYRQLRTRILRDIRANNWRTLAITSAHTGEGKTLTAVNIAIALAQEVNQTVLLVDLDFKGPNVMDVLGIKVDAGLVECLKGEVELKDIMVNPGLDRLVVIPALPVKGHTSEILSSPTMRTVLEEIINQYDDRLIIFDLPPLLLDDDALVFTPYVDASLLIVESGGRTRARDVEHCLQLLQGTNVIGTVFNKLAEYELG